VKNHKEEQQWSPVVFSTGRAASFVIGMRVCGEAMDVWALGVQNRGVGSVVAPNQGDHLECEECGMYRYLPVGAPLRAYRYKTRPWK
jgi:NADH-quinone oxidoreductase subunit G